MQLIPTMTVMVIFLPTLRKGFFLFEYPVYLSLANVGCRSQAPVVDIDDDSNSDLPTISS